MLLVEEHSGPERAERTAVLKLRIALHLNRQLLDQALRRVAVRKRRRDALRAAIADERPPLIAELVPLGVSAEVVVVVEDQDLLVRSERAAPEVRCGEARNAGADDHEIVGLARAGVRCGELTVRALLERRERLDGCGGVAAQAGERGRIRRLGLREIDGDAAQAD